ncbi:hypothetical protein BDP27DRAFT_1318635 [Rhodocollybia butyracea]|uniref:Uncharacterized protein n=1 Tax=Rhodocollybia butyracea TaxID=206335 RepID=A0A9P5Q2L0_9AGAR|nr:hypothetical protein BDP27DRAFT_1318635 [Rhodocollybia butyracea]
MSSDERTLKDLSVISPQESRRKYRVDSRFFVKCFYIIFTRGMFFFGLTVATRHLWLMFVHVNLETRLSNPNQNLYQNQTLDEVTDQSLVVQPLIGEDQYFDIGVTIWVRASAEEERKLNVSDTGRLRSAALRDGPVDLSRFRRTQAPSRNREMSIVTSGANPDALFNIIYSDIAFRQLQLSDVSLTTVVNFSIPASYFPDLKKEWSGQDMLKAAFTILPTSHSHLDNIKTYSSWIHESGIKPMRSWPFPFGTRKNDSKSLGDEAVDLLSFVMPLIQSFRSPHPCAANANTLDYLTETPVPHVVSRTHIQIVKVLEIMNFDLFNKSHHDLKSANCGKSSELDDKRRRKMDLPEGSPMKWVTSCQRNYPTTGILETLFEFGAPLDDGSNQTEWAYAPYLEANDYGLGPKDFSPIPMRSVCNINSTDPSNRSSLLNPLVFNISDSGLNISWRITYSGISLPERTVFNSMNSLITSDEEKFLKAGSDYQKVMLQDKIDQRNSLFGVYREDNAHPRRRLFLNFLSKSLLIITSAFDALYWYTRTTTSFISILGSLLLAVASLIQCVFIVQGRDAWSSYPNKRPYQSFLRISRFLLVVPILLQATWMSMVALRIELVWPYGSEHTFLRRIVPAVRRFRPNHRERASERMERSIIRWRSRIAIIASLLIAYHFLLPHTPKIAAQLHPDPDPTVLEAKMLYGNLVMKQSIADPLFVSGKIFQLTLNNSSGFFAGSYRVSAMAKAAAVCLDILHFISWVVGLPESRGGMDAMFVIYAALTIIEGWQAITLPRAVDDEVDDEQE